jgi:glutamate synthase (ferredoxin)
MNLPGTPPKQGLYDPQYEHDACGVGFVVDLKGRQSHDIVQKAVQVLLNLQHRGACGCEKNTGDGAGILLQLPHRFFQQQCDRLDIRLPEPGQYGVGMVFLPTDPADRRRCEELFEQVVREEGQQVLGWRTVPTDNSPIGPTARRVEPAMRQIFIRDQRSEIRDQRSEIGDRSGGCCSLTTDLGSLAFERKLYVIRKRVENAVRASDIPQRGMFYVPSLSCRTIIYKGMLIADQLPVYYPDIVDPAVESALAMVHSRFSTNTFPNWARAHPYRYL